ncbi:MAG: enol-CoA hydratase [Porticoccaceae bacterium]|nr:MAG: enol-CoA hydratase [Porticoccaceae bacterium]
MSEDPLLVETLGAANDRRVGIATLNAPRSLNALTLEMAEALFAQLAAWREDPAVACVVLRGSGERAFCAGGDVVRLRQSALAGDDHAARFFEREYRLDYLIHTYPKPIAVWGHGVVMGGGLGLMVGASHRIVTPQTRMAMPEVTVGLYPDVGGSWFLNRMPGRTGLFLALSGAPLNAADALWVGLADRFLRHDQWEAFVAGLAAIAWEEDPGRHAGQLSRLLRVLEAEAGERPASVVREHYDQIQALTDADSLLELVERITAYDGPDPWLQGAARTLASGCPTSVHLIWEQLRRTRHASLKEVFMAELILSINCMRFGNFAEGVRALLVDKDRKPRFAPAELRAVTPELVAAHFAAPWGDGPNPLADL